MDSIPRKQCRRCGLHKPPSDFYRAPRYADGLYPWCKPCHKAYRDANREKRLAQMKAWREERAADPVAMEQERERARAYYHADETRKRRYRDRMNAYDRAQWAADPAYRERKNLQKAESVRRRAGDPVFQRRRKVWDTVKNQRRRARLAGAAGSHTSAEWRALCRAYGGRCACCGKEAELTADHIVPLSRGGSNDIANIQPLCGPCNSKKYTKTVDYRQNVQLAMDL